MPEGRTHPCQVCDHPSRLALEQALMNGKSAREVARTFSIGSYPGTDRFKPDHKKVTKHEAEHMKHAVQIALAQRDAESGHAILDRLADLDAAVDETLTRARKGAVVRDADGQPVLDPESGDYLRTYPERVILAAVREGRQNADLRGRLAGALPEAEEGAADAARRALHSDKARALIAELEAEAARTTGQPNGV